MATRRSEPASRPRQRPHEAGIFIFGAGYSGRAFAARINDRGQFVRHDALRGKIRAAAAAGTSSRSCSTGTADAGTRRGARPDTTIWSSRSRRARRAIRSSTPRATRSRRTCRTGLDRLSLHRRRLWRPWRRLGRRDKRHAGRCRARSRACGSRPKQDWLALGRRHRPAGRGAAPVGHLRAGPQRFRQSRQRHRRRLVKPGQVFNRIHVDDIAGALWHLAESTRRRHLQRHRRSAGAAAGCRRLCRELMGVAPPPEIPFDTAQLSPMARSFYGENKRVSNRGDQGGRLSLCAFRDYPRGPRRHVGERQTGAAAQARSPMQAAMIGTIDGQTTLAFHHSVTMRPKLRRGQTRDGCGHDRHDHTGAAGCCRRLWPAGWRWPTVRRGESAEELAKDLFGAERLPAATAPRNPIGFY